jgi:hypothetical protein
MNFSSSWGAYGGVEGEGVAVMGVEANATGTATSAASRLSLVFMGFKKERGNVSGK